MDRFWFITWTTYGTWLPGDERGFVGPIQDEAAGTQRIENRPKTPYLKDVKELKQYTRSQLKCDPIYLTRDQAKSVATQFQETAEYRRWKLPAFAIMRNHVHIVVAVPGDPDPENLLRDFKSYASRRLNQTWEKPGSETWWTESGSKRKLANESAVHSAVVYVKNQEDPLVVEIDLEWDLQKSNGSVSQEVIKHS